MNQLQFQRGVCMPQFFERYSTEDQRATAMVAMRRPGGFLCLRCSSDAHYVVGHGQRKLFHCRDCRRQTSLTAGSMMDTKLPLRTWFLAIFLISQAKTGLSALALKRQIDTSYRTARLTHQKVIATMAQRESELPFTGLVQMDDAYLGGKLIGVVGRGSPNKMPIVAAVSTDDAGHPMRGKLGCLTGFTV